MKISNVKATLTSRHVRGVGFLPDREIPSEDVTIKPDGGLFVSRNEPGLDKYGKDYTYTLVCEYDFDYGEWNESIK